jgi:hypothetical protein
VVFCLLFSSLLHGAALYSFGTRKNARQLQPIAINYSTGDKKKTKKPAGKKLNLNPASGPRVGSPDYLKQKRDLGTTLTALHFIERLHAHIDPNWHSNIDRARLPVKACSTVLNIDALPNGTIISIVTVQNNCSQKLKQVAIDTLWTCHLLPVPKNLISKNGLFELEWTFTIKHKD